jgi:CRP/FNR family transcriptional regulator, cyclic AMP receptor protein
MGRSCLARTKDTRLAQLGQVDLFRTCNKAHLARIGQASDEIQVPAGHVLCRQGEPGSEFYLMLTGEAAVKRNGRKVASIGPGSSFGELALLTRLPRNATIETTEDATLLVLTQRDFAALLDELPGMAHGLLEVVAQRLADVDTRSVTN